MNETRLIMWSKNDKGYILKYVGDGKEREIVADTKAKLKAQANKLGISLDETFYK